MKKNPNNVTRFGASHSGSNSTNAFHYVRSGHVAIARVQGAYIMLEDVAGNEGLVDARVFVRSKVLQRIFRDALMPRSFCSRRCVSECAAIVY
jgi:hypothetical protein